MARTVENLFFYTIEQVFPGLDSTLYQVDPDGTIQVLVDTGEFSEFWGAASAGDTVYFQGVSAESGPGLYGLNADGTYFYTGLWGTIDYGFGDLLYVEGYDESLWTIDADGSLVSLGIAQPGGFVEYGDSLYFQGSGGLGERALYKVDASGSLSLPTYNGWTFSYYASPVELNDNLYFRGSTAGGDEGVFEIDAQGSITRLNVDRILDAVPGLSSVVTEIDGVWYFEVTAPVGPLGGNQTSLVSYEVATGDVDVYGNFGSEYVTVGDDVYVYQPYGREAGLFKAGAAGELIEVALPAGVEPFGISELVEFNGELVIFAYNQSTGASEEFHVSEDGTVASIDVPGPVLSNPVECDGSLWVGLGDALVEIKDDWSVTFTSYEPAGLHLLA